MAVFHRIYRVYCPYGIDANGQISNNVAGKIFSVDTEIDNNVAVELSKLCTYIQRNENSGFLEDAFWYGIYYDYSQSETPYPYSYIIHQHYDNDSDVKKYEIAGAKGIRSGYRFKILVFPQNTYYRAIEYINRDFFEKNFFYDFQSNDGTPFREYYQVFNFDGKPLNSGDIYGTKNVPANFTLLDTNDLEEIHTNDFSNGFEEDFVNGIISKNEVQSAIIFLTEQYKLPYDERKIIVIRGNSQRIVKLIAAITNAFPLGMAKYITFCINYSLENDVNSPISPTFSEANIVGYNTDILHLSKVPYENMVFIENLPSAEYFDTQTKTFLEAIPDSDFFNFMGLNSDFAAYQENFNYYKNGFTQWFQKFSENIDEYKNSINKENINDFKGWVNWCIDGHFCVKFDNSNAEFRTLCREIYLDILEKNILEPDDFDLDELLEYSDYYDVYFQRIYRILTNNYTLSADNIRENLTPQSVFQRLINFNYLDIATQIAYKLLETKNIQLYKFSLLPLGDMGIKYIENFIKPVLEFFAYLTLNYNNVVERETVDYLAKAIYYTIYHLSHKNGNFVCYFDMKYRNKNSNPLFLRTLKKEFYVNTPQYKNLKVENVFLDILKIFENKENNCHILSGFYKKGEKDVFSKFFIDYYKNTNFHLGQSSNGNYNITDSIIFDMVLEEVFCYIYGESVVGGGVNFEYEGKKQAFINAFKALERLGIPQKRIYDYFESYISLKENIEENSKKQKNFLYYMYFFEYFPNYKVDICVALLEKILPNIFVTDYENSLTKLNPNYCLKYVEILKKLLKINDKSQNSPKFIDKYTQKLNTLFVNKFFSLENFTDYLKKKKSTGIIHEICDILENKTFPDYVKFLDILNNPPKNYTENPLTSIIINEQFREDISADFSEVIYNFLKNGEKISEFIWFDVLLLYFLSNKKVNIEKILKLSAKSYAPDGTLVFIEICNILGFISGDGIPEKFYDMDIYLNKNTYNYLKKLVKYGIFGFKLDENGKKITLNGNYYFVKSKLMNEIVREINNFYHKRPYSKEFIEAIKKFSEDRTSLSSFLKMKIMSEKILYFDENENIPTEFNSSFGNKKRQVMQEINGIELDYPIDDSD